ncbi:hypothetical protein ABER99_20065 [Paenibacillus glucanolyticus]|jgi:hypothetical protein|uniref:Uncharacterized protein n=1 Tax=Paenibacillus glucanolyticus TaxID=59843 RepID=A0A163GN28_9BACL|nr:hypothetical protein [Paenibacillus glucanolyticus]KZS45054.1 hypothetical protein AWU65_03470 [Paenibacillus glucanolyticus]OMF63874.1 hypothetical protein BK142_32410 [Paenibacillus glucanolyticus]
MKEKAKEFKRGVGFTFTPSRIPDAGEVDFIDELNRILALSNLSQNKFTEIMLKEAVEYQKIKKTQKFKDLFETNEQGLIIIDEDDSTSNLKKPLIQTVNSMELNQNAHSSSTSQVKEKDDFEHSQMKAVEDKNSSVNSKDVVKEPVVNDVLRKAMERANKTKLKS